MSDDPKFLYRQLGQLVAETADLASGPITAETLRGTVRKVASQLDIGPPKSTHGRRDIEVALVVVDALRAELMHQRSVFGVRLSWHYL